MPFIFKHFQPNQEFLLPTFSTKHGPYSLARLICTGAVWYLIYVLTVCTPTLTSFI